MFDWLEYKKLCSELKDNNSQAYKRTILSRLYYTVYNEIKEQLPSITNENRGGHNNFWVLVSNSRLKNHQRLSSNCRQLLEWRKDADYKKDIFITDKKVEMAFKYTDEILDFFNINQK